MEENNKYIRFDWAMKPMLRDKANFDILKGLISVLLGEDIKIEEILESESNQATISERFNRMELLSRDSQGDQILVKLQLLRKRYYYTYLRRGTCEVIGNKNENRPHYYSQIRRVCSIHLLYCDYGNGKDYVYHGNSTPIGIHTGDTLYVKEKQKGVIVPNIPESMSPEYYIVRIYAYDKTPETPLDEWMRYLKDGIIKEDTCTLGLQQAQKKLRIDDMVYGDYKKYLAYVEEMMIQEDMFDTARLEGYWEGFEEVLKKIPTKTGEQEDLKDGLKTLASIVKRMVVAGMTDEMILQVTGITKEELTRIRKQG